MTNLQRKKIVDGFANPQERYAATNCIKTSLKLNRKTDADLIEALEGKARQTEIKRLVRLGLEAEKHK